MTEKILLYLKEEKAFLSGEELARKLNVSRASIWKNISKLRNMGYNIISSPNKGYLLVESDDDFNEFEIKLALETEFIGKNLKFFKEIDSTNTFAKSFAEQNSNIDGLAIVSSHQTKGKGRLGRNWEMEKDKAIALSLILTPDISPFEATNITLLIGISVCRAIKKFTNLPAKIKWPNDIIINEKKVAGILVEISAEIEMLKYAIVGIGVNVNNEIFSADLCKKASSLKLESGENFNRSLLLAEILLEIEKIYQEYKKNFSFEPFLDEYKSLCLNIGREVKLKYKNQMICGTVLDISPQGELILLNSDGEKISISSGEVSLRNINGEYI